MVLFLNFLLVLLLLGVSSIGYYKYKKTKDMKWAVITLVVNFLVVIIYNTIQPSYLPKGEAPKMVGVPYESYEYEVRDLSVKPLSKEDSKQRVDSLITVREEVKAILDKK